MYFYAVVVVRIAHDYKGGKSSDGKIEGFHDDETDTLRML